MVSEVIVAHNTLYLSVVTVRCSAHGMVECRKHTLGIIDMLQSKILIGSRTNGFYQVMQMYVTHYVIVHFTFIRSLI